MFDNIDHTQVEVVITSASFKTGEIIRRRHWLHREKTRNFVGQSISQIASSVTDDRQTDGDATVSSWLFQSLGGYKETKSEWNTGIL